MKNSESPKHGDADGNAVEDRSAYGSQARDPAALPGSLVSDPRFPPSSNRLHRRLRRAGRYKGGELGSPVIAVNVATNHRKAHTGELVFWFIDEREDRIEHLRRELDGMTIPPHFKVRAVAGSFHEKVGPLLESIEDDGSQLAPTFAFIDPFGFSGISFTLIERLLKHPRCEVLITFMVDAINRFLKHPKPTVVQHIVDAFGTDEANRIAEAPGKRIEQLQALYQSRLQGVAKYVLYCEMRDRNDRPQY